MRISDWSSDVCSSDLVEDDRQRVEERRGRAAAALAATIVSDAVDALTSAVDHARALGADADARCDALRVKLDGATRRADAALARLAPWRSEEHTSALQSLMRISYAVFCLKKKTHDTTLKKHKQSRVNMSSN